MHPEKIEAHADRGSQTAINTRNRSMPGQMPGTVCGTPGPRHKAHGATEYMAMDIFRVVAALLVITIHTSPLTSFSDTADFLLTRVLARVAVPFFFMATGFFLLPGGGSRSGSGDCSGGRSLPDGDPTSGRSQSNGGRSRSGSGNCSGKRRLSGSIKKLCLLYAIAIIIYIPLNIYSGQLEISSPLDVFRLLLFDGTFYHLWYLPAAMVGLMLMALLQRFFSLKGCLIISLILYGIGLGGDSYYGLISMLPPLKAVYDGLFTISSYTRNGIFLAPIFLCLGWLVKEMQKSWQIQTCGRRGGRQADMPGAIFFKKETVPGFFFLSLGLMAAEALLLRFLGWQRHDSMYIFLLPCMVFLFAWLARTPAGSGVPAPSRRRPSDPDVVIPVAPSADGRHNPRQRRSLSKRMGPMLRSISLTIYLIHPWVIVIVRGIAKVLHLEKLLVNQSFIHFIAVALCSCIMAVILWICKQNLTIFQKRQKA